MRTCAGTRSTRSCACRVDGRCCCRWVEPKAKPITAINSPTTSCCLLRCAVIRRRDRLPLHRLATLDDLAVGGVVLEERRQPIALAEHRRVLQVEVQVRSEEHTSELQSLMRISYAVFCLKKKKNTKHHK